jgi:2-methylcitrate dehydratase PrpD
MASRNGVLAASLAQLGLTASESVLEGPKGFAALMGGGEQDLSEALQDLGETFHITSAGGLCLKFYTSCYMTHRFIDAALYLRERFGIRAADVKSVSYRLPQVLRDSLPRALPVTGQQGTGSIEYCISAALLDGEITSRQFTDEMVQRREAQELCRRVRGTYPGWPSTTAEAMKQPQQVVVELNNGERFEHELEYAKGDVRNPMSYEECAEKFRDSATGVLQPELVDKVIDAVLAMETVADCDELMKCLRGTL